MKPDFVGQKPLITQISNEIENGVFPRFSIFVGQPGDEKNKFAQLIAHLLNAHYVLADCKVDSIRDIIIESYKCQTVTVYAINNVDDMSLQAKNALLKVTEEPPNKAYFVMTLDNIDNTLPTIKSRGSVYHLIRYSRDELSNYAKSQYDDPEPIIERLMCFCETPGDIDVLHVHDVEEFLQFVDKVFKNVATVSGSNAFKIADSLKFKDADDKYDLRLFWEAFSDACVHERYQRGIMITLNYLSALRSKSINKIMLFDMWLFDIRKEWKNGSC